VILLVASFISLTSFTSGFGLSLEKSGAPIDKDGVMIRTPDPPPTIGTAPSSGGIGVSGPLPLDFELVRWFSEATAVNEVIPRYENQPQREYREGYSPVGFINRTTVFGILSVNPRHEAEVNQLDSAVAEGEYMGDGVGEAMVSLGLAERLGVSLGDTFAFRAHERTHELTVVALLDDAILEELTDIDGDTILPRKIIEKERIEADGPDFIIEAVAPCSPNEIVITNLGTTVNMTWLMLTRYTLPS